METAGSGALDVRGVANDEFLRVEQHALEPIPLADRHGSPRGLFLLWAASQANFTSLLTGAILLAFFGLGLIDAITAAFVGALAAAVVLGLLSVIGPRTGATQVVASRLAFGTAGAYAGAFLTLVLAVGWFAVVSVLATDAILELIRKAGAAPGDGVAAAVLAIVLVLGVLVGVFGHQTISVFERYGAVVFLGFCIVLFATLLPDINWGHPATVHGGARAGKWLFGAGTFFALVASWYGFVSDYSRYLPPDVSGRKVALYAGGGIVAATAVLGAFGILLFTIDPNPDNAIYSAINAAAPGWLSTLFFAWVALSLIWGAYFDVYTAGLATLAMGIPLSRWGGALLCGVAGGALAFYAKFASGGVLTSYEDFLLFSYVWAPAWAAVVLADFFLIRGPEHPRGGVLGRVTRAFNVRALAAWLIGTLVAIPFVNVSLWTGPIPERWLAGADISGFVGFIVGGIVYLMIAERAPASVRRGRPHPAAGG